MSNAESQPPKRVLICGGRDWSMTDMTFAALDRLNEKHNFGVVIHGAARGADRLGGEWAKSRNIPVIEFPADWRPSFINGRPNPHRRLDRSAGHRRNQQMLEEGHPDLVVAFPGGPGTRSMIQKARAAGVRVINLKGIRAWWQQNKLARDASRLQTAPTHVIIERES